MFKVKYCPHGSIKRYKERLVTQGFAQVHEIDYTKTFTSIMNQKLLRIFLTITAILRMITMQIDVIGAYLKSSLGQNKHQINTKIPQECITG